MSSKYAKDREPMPYQVLLDENQALSDENQALKGEIESLRARLDEAEELKRAISEGDLDALVITGPEEELIFTLDSADRAYRVLVETMNEGTATLAYDGTILYCNRRFAELLMMPSQAIVGTSIYRFIAPDSTINFNALLKQKINAGEVNLQPEGGRSLPVYLSINSLQADGSPNAWCLVVTDLTEQKKSEEILASERLARSIIEQSAETIVVCDTSGRITRFSNSMLKLSGCDPRFHRFEDVIDLRFTEGADAGKSILPISTALKGSTILGMEATFESENRQKFHLLLNSGPLKNAEGEIIGCVVNLTDITVLKLAEETLQKAYEELQTQSEELEAQSEELQSQAEELRKANEALSESEERYRTLFKTMTEGFALHEIITDGQGRPCDYRFLDVNPAFEQLTGLKNTDLIGKRVLEILPNTEPHCIDNYGRVALTGEPLHIENYSSELDRWYEVLAYRTKPGRFAVVFTDVTVRKRAEEALREAEEIARQRLMEIEDLYRNAPVGLCVLDRELRFVRINERLAEINGFPAAAHIGKRIRDMVPQLADAAEPEMLRILETGEPRLNIEIVGETLSQPGVKRSWLEQWLPITDAQGHVTGLNIVVEETTERKKAEEAVQESEAKYRQIVETSQEGIWLIDRKDRTVFVNQKVSEMLGYSIEEILEQSPQKFMSPEFRAESEDRLREDKGGRHVIDYRFIRKDGSDFWCILSSSPLFDNQGNYAGSLAMITDITERKQAEEKLQQALTKAEEGDRLLAALMENVPEGITIADAFGRLRMVSRSGDELLGGAHADKSVDEVVTQWTVYQPNGITPMATDDLPLIRAIQKGEVVRNAELVQVNIHGEKLSLLCNAAPIRDARGNVTGGIVAWHDITERKRAEEALKKARETLEEKVKERTDELEEAYNSLLENEMRLSEAQKIAHLGNWDWNLLTDELYWSDEIYRIFRLDPLELVPTYNEFLSHIDPEDRNRVNNATQRALKGEPFNIEYRINVPDGEKRIVNSQAEAIFDEKGTPILMRGIIQDITERKMAEEALERVDKIRIKEIHHRIKNNLQVISSLLDLQVEKFEDEKVREAFKEGQNRVISMSLIHEELYKGEGTDTLDFSVYLQKLAENLFHTYSLNSKNIRLRTDLEESALLDMDIAVPLGIIVNELVSNSLKHAFTESKEGEIRVRLCREGKKSSEINKSLFSLTVSDNGGGIPEDIELESVESLGLQLVNILVDQLDGEVELKRMHGTEFRITFRVEGRFAFPD